MAEFKKHGMEMFQKGDKSHIKAMQESARANAVAQSNGRVV